MPTKGKRKGKAKRSAPQKAGPRALRPAGEQQQQQQRRQVEMGHRVHQWTSSSEDERPWAPPPGGCGSPRSSGVLEARSSKVEGVKVVPTCGECYTESDSFADSDDDFSDGDFPLVGGLEESRSVEEVASAPSRAPTRHPEPSDDSDGVVAAVCVRRQHPEPSDDSDSFAADDAVFSDDDHPLPGMDRSASPRRRFFGPNNDTSASPRRRARDKENGPTSSPGRRCSDDDDDGPSPKKKRESSRRKERDGSKENMSLSPGRRAGDDDGPSPKNNKRESSRRKERDDENASTLPLSPRSVDDELPKNNKREPSRRKETRKQKLRRRGVDVPPPVGDPDSPHTTRSPSPVAVEPPESENRALSPQPKVDDDLKPKNRRKEKLQAKKRASLDAVAKKNHPPGEDEQPRDPSEGRQPNQQKKDVGRSVDRDKGATGVEEQKMTEPKKIESCEKPTLDVGRTKAKAVPTEPCKRSKSKLATPRETRKRQKDDQIAAHAAPSPDKVRSKREVKRKHTDEAPPQTPPKRTETPPPRAKLPSPSGKKKATVKASFPDTASSPRSSPSKEPCFDDPKPSKTKRKDTPGAADDKKAVAVEKKKTLSLSEPKVGFGFGLDSKGKAKKDELGRAVDVQPPLTTEPPAENTPTRMPVEPCESRREEKNPRAVPVDPPVVASPSTGPPSGQGGTPSRSRTAPPTRAPPPDDDVRVEIRLCAGIGKTSSKMSLRRQPPGPEYVSHISPSPIVRRTKPKPEPSACAGFDARRGEQILRDRWLRIASLMDSNKHGTSQPPFFASRGFRADTLLGGTKIPVVAL